MQKSSGLIIAVGILLLMILLLIGGCATLPENFDRPEAYAYTDTEDTRLGKATAVMK